MYQEGDSMQARGIIRKCFPLIQLVPFTIVQRTRFLGFSVTFLFILAHIYGTETFFWKSDTRLKLWYSFLGVLFYFLLYTCILHLWNDHVFLKCLISMSPKICLKCLTTSWKPRSLLEKNHQNDDPLKQLRRLKFYYSVFNEYASKWTWNTNITLNHRKFWNYLNFPEINTYRLKSQQSQTSSYKMS